MGLFTRGKKDARTIALIDIGSASIGGAYVYYEQGSVPAIYYTARVDVEPRLDETIADSMLRSLAFLGELMTAEGAPQLRRETGSARIEEVVAAIAAPWQETVITTTHIEEPRPFVFSRKHLAAANSEHALKDGWIASGNRVIATLLNGYEVPNPLGKRASSAELVLLSSAIDKRVAHDVRTALRKTFHTGDIELAAFAPAAYEVFRSLYPLQKEFIVIDVSGSGTDLVVVKRGMLAGVSSVPQGTHDLLAAARKAGKRAHLGSPELIDTSANDSFAKEAEAIESAWLEGLKDGLASFSSDQALPRTVFLLADQGSREYLKRLIETSGLKALWLEQEPFAVLTIEPAHLASLVKTRGLGEGDLFLAILALSRVRSDAPREEHEELIAGPAVIPEAS